MKIDTDTRTALASAIARDTTLRADTISMSLDDLAAAAGLPTLDWDNSVRPVGESAIAMTYERAARRVTVELDDDNREWVATFGTVAGGLFNVHGVRYLSDVRSLVELKDWADNHHSRFIAA